MSLEDEPKRRIIQVHERPKRNEPSPKEFGGFSVQISQKSMWEVAYEDGGSFEAPDLPGLLEGLRKDSEAHPMSRSELTISPSLTRPGGLLQGKEKEVYAAAGLSLPDEMSRDTTAFRHVWFPPKQLEHEVSGAGGPIQPVEELPEGSFKLRDGSVAQIVEAGPNDKEKVGGFFKGLSEASSTMRFVSPVSDKIIDEYVGRMFAEGSQHRVALAVRQGEIVGVAQYSPITKIEHEYDEFFPEMAVAVADEHHGKGIGQHLFEWVLASVRNEPAEKSYIGVTGYAYHTNVPMRALVQDNKERLNYETRVMSIGEGEIKERIIFNAPKS